ncbi:MAG TPA: aromatic acid exporter family protein, partial [Kutzneria sp.]|nr:aromatic acid exporter family protein [Kutzneria sp.]
ARGVDPVRTRALLRTSAAETDSLLAVDDFSVRVMVAQLRSIVVDLLVAAGVTRSDALSALPPL